MQVNRIRARMTELGFTQEKLANAMGITVQTLNAKLNGRSGFSLDEAISVTKILSLEDPLEIFFKESSHICNDIIN